MRARAGILRRAVLAAAFCLSAAGGPACAQDPPPDEVLLIDDDFALARKRLVEDHLAPELDDVLVLMAMEKVPRHRFVPRDLWEHAYEDRPCRSERGRRSRSRTWWP